MSVFFFLVPLSLVLSLAALAAFIHASRSGQFDDLDTPSHKLIHDHDSSEEIS